MRLDEKEEAKRAFAEASRIDFPKSHPSARTRHDFPLPVEVRRTSTLLQVSEEREKPPPRDEEAALRC